VHIKILCILSETIRLPNALSKFYGLFASTNSSTAMAVRDNHPANLVNVTSYLLHAANPLN
jgi:hypothetical protein